MLVMIRKVFLVGPVNSMLMHTDPEWSLSYLHAASSIVFVIN